MALIAAGVLSLAGTYYAGSMATNNAKKAQKTQEKLAYAGQLRSNALIELAIIGVVGTVIAFSLVRIVREG